MLRPLALTASTVRSAALLAVALAATASAQQADSADARRPPLFVLEDDDSRVYLLGSVHVLPVGALPLPAHVEAAYAEASVVAFELDLDAAEAGAAGMLAAAVDEVTVADALTRPQRDSLDAALGALGLPAGALDPFEPWFVGMTVGVLSLQQSGLPVTVGGVDRHFFDRARADDKERVAFETVELQTAAFDDLPTDVQVDFLMATIATPADSTAGTFAHMVEAWAAGDDDALAALLDDELSDPAVFEALLVTRNRAWIGQIESLLAREGETALVVVGAGHLLGESSVVAMLRQAGYAVERL